MRNSSEFSRAYRIGRRHRCGPVTVITCSGPAGPPTVGFVAGKKVGSAVKRNRAKRRMREAAARCQLRSDTVYVLVADTGVLSADFGSLIGWIDTCTSKEPRVEGRA